MWCIPAARSAEPHSKANVMAKYGCPFVSDEEITVAAKALSEASNWTVQGQGARNMAYRALLAVRAAHFDEARELGVPPMDRPR
jgi:hypothetical protein